MQVAEALAEGRTPPAVRLRTILKYALKLVGLALVGIGTSLPEASAALACALVACEGLASARYAHVGDKWLPHVLHCYLLYVWLSPVLGMLFVAISLGTHWLPPYRVWSPCQC